MEEKKRTSPWLWIPSLCVAEEIPLAVVMFVALLMFLQFGASVVWASVFVALLFLPWMLKSYFYSKVRKAGAFKRFLHIDESLMFLCLMGLAVYISEADVQLWVLFVFLFLLSCFCAWHELLSRLYYSRMLFPRQQQLFFTTKMLSSQAALVVTYGLLIIVAGFFEVFFRSYQKAWAMESSLVAGGFLFFLVLNVLLLQNPKSVDLYQHETLADTVKSEWRIVSRIRQKPRIVAVVFTLFFLLLPQALMFNTRVFFLLTPSTSGGLDCSVQDVGFAQGTIGVLAFSFGTAIGRMLALRWGEGKMFWWAAVVLTLSPVSYMLMALCPQVNRMLPLCCMTFFAQLCFGFGLSGCRAFIVYVSGHRYRNTTNFLYVPLVVSLMILPMALSGWVCQQLGFLGFFTLCVSAAPFAWLIAAICRIKKILIQNE